MAVIFWRDSNMKNTKLSSLVTKLQSDFPALNFLTAAKPRWSPEDQTVYYNDGAPHSAWSLLHELGHAICNHHDYESDIGLLQMEVEAWDQAQIRARTYGHSIPQDYIEKCLDSYRDWLYKRSTCPSCLQTGLEQKTGQYHCINCVFKWRVSPERFCRVYRQQTKLPT
jgi:hypothetical protein